MSCSKKIKNGELLELIAWGRAELLRAGIEEAQEECERMLIKLLGCPRSAIYLDEHSTDVERFRERFLTWIEKRVRRIPLAYLLNEADFWHETLFVDERCLIPRPETEVLVEVVIREMKKAPHPSPLPKGEGENGIPLLGERLGEGENGFSFLDIGTGSGAIAIALLRACKKAQGTLLDVSAAALDVARINLEKYGFCLPVIASEAKQSSFKDGIATVPPSEVPRNDVELKVRARLVQGDLFGPFLKDEKWDLIISNPPYLSETDWIGVQEELKFEPRGALDGGKDGLEFYRKIVAGAQARLAPGGLLALEVGQGQAGMVSKWLQEAGYDNIHRFNDLLGIERVLIAKNK
jgi:release factor glutamine methyltransferase